MYEVHHKESFPSVCAVRCAECQQDISGQDVISHLFLMEHLASNSENKGSETAKTYTCTSCEDSASATGFCVDCQDWLCQTCIDAHQRVRVTKDHTIKTKDELEGEKPATLGQKYMFCENHKQVRRNAWLSLVVSLTKIEVKLQVRVKSFRFLMQSRWPTEFAENTWGWQLQML